MLDVYTLSRIPGLQACHLVDDFLLSTETPLDSLGENVTLIQCDLVNSTYTTTFNFVDGSQDVDIQVDKSEEGIEVVRTVNWGHDPKLCLQDEDDPTESTDCKFDHSVLWRISYQSVMSAFSSMFTGQVTQNTNLDARNVNTSVTMTSLADTEDFAFLNEDYLGNDDSETGWNLQDFMANWNASESQGVTYDNETELNGNSTQRNSLPLDEALEQLFQNFTVSLMSLPDLRADKASITAPPPVNVTFPSSVPTYTYAREKLWLTYGIAILLSIASTIFGTAVMFASGKSFDCNFSTILRTTRHADLDKEVEASDTTGSAPLPRYLADAHIRFNIHGSYSGVQDGSSMEMNVLPSQEPLLAQPTPPTTIAPDENVDRFPVQNRPHSSSISAVTIEDNDVMSSGSTSVSEIEGHAERYQNADVDTRSLD